VTKTARFLDLVTERHGSLASIPLGAVAGISADLAPRVGLHPGAARAALRKAVLAAKNEDLRVERHPGCLRGADSGIVCTDDVGCLFPGRVGWLAAAPCRRGHAKATWHSEGQMTDGKKAIVGLADAVKSLRAELMTAVEAGKGQPMQFSVKTRASSQVSVPWSRPGAGGWAGGVVRAGLAGW
jgi:hypothetical protein